MKKDILFIAKSDQILKYMMGLLREMNVSVQIGRDFSLITDLNREYKPHLILCEAVPPIDHISGLVAAFKGHEKYQSTPFVLILPDSQTHLEYTDKDMLGPVDALIKYPCDKVDLWATVQRLTDPDESAEVKQIPVEKKAVRKAKKKKHKPTETKARVTEQAAPAEPPEPDHSPQITELDPPIKKIPEIQAAQVDEPAQEDAEPEPAPATQARPQVKIAKSWKKSRVNIITMSRLFWNIIDKQITGILYIKGDRRKMKISIDAAKVTIVKSNYVHGDSLGRLLIHDNVITRSENVASLKKAKKQGVPQGQILLQMKLLSNKRLNSYLSKQKTRKLLRLFSGDWDKSLYEFVQKPIEDQSDAMKPLPMDEILKTGILEKANYNLIYKTLYKNDKNYCPIRLNSRFDQAAELFDLNDRQIRLADWVELKTVDEIKNLHSDRYEKAIRLIYLLHIAKAIQFKSPIMKEPSGGTAAKPRLPREEIPPIAIREKQLLQEEHKDEKGSLLNARDLFEKGEFTKAKPILQQFVELDPQNADALAMLAWVSFKLHRISDSMVVNEAKDMLKKAINSNPQSDLAHLILGKIFKHEGNDVMAESCFIKALNLNPSNEEAERLSSIMGIRKRGKSENQIMK